MVISVPAGKSMLKSSITARTSSANSMVFASLVLMMLILTASSPL